jgi:hypothetical protein
LSLGEEILQSITADDQVTLVADYEMIALELDEEFGYPRTRSAHQVSEILVSCGYRQMCSAFLVEAEIVAQLKQNQGQTLFQRAAHEVRAAQLNQVPPATAADDHPLEVFQGYSERDFDERFQVDSSNLTVGYRLAKEVIADPG